MIPLVLWLRLRRQLRLRGRGVRESGAFLLGRKTETGDRVRSFVCFDVLDPTCLDKGYIEFHAAGYAALWAACRRQTVEVLADVHTHPGSNSSQSETDRIHPMISEQGYVAIILPNYSRDSLFQISRMSVYEYCGDYCWTDWTGDRRRNRLRFVLW